MDFDKKIQLVWKSDSSTEMKPTWVQIKKDATKVTAVEGDAEIIDVTTIKDTSQDKMCTFQVSQVDIPDEVIGAGYKFESYCCVKFNSDSKGLF